MRGGVSVAERVAERASDSVSKLIAELACDGERVAELIGDDKRTAKRVTERAGYSKRIAHCFAQCSGNSQRGYNAVRLYLKVSGAVYVRYRKRVPHGNPQCKLNNNPKPLARTGSWRVLDGTVCRRHTVLVRPCMLVVLHHYHCDSARGLSVRQSGHWRELGGPRFGRGPPVG